MQQQQNRRSAGGQLRPLPLPLLTVLGPELDRFLAGDLLAELDQRCLAGDQLAGGELQGL